jgi:hypothetical protein
LSEINRPARTTASRDPLRGRKAVFELGAEAAKWAQDHDPRSVIEKLGLKPDSGLDHSGDDPAFIADLQQPARNLLAARRRA